MKTLVIRPGALGDTILTLPLLNSLITMDPLGSLTFLGTGSYLPLVSHEIESLPVDGTEAVWLFEETPRHLAYVDFSFDQAYVILRHPRAVMKNLYQAGTKNLIAVSPIPFPGKHVVETMHKCAALPCPARTPALMMSEAVKTRNVVWIHPGSGGKKKCAPLELFTILARFLQETYGAEIVVTASEQDRFITQSYAWKKFFGETGAALMMNRPLIELCQELKGTRLFLGNDSGIAHLAAAMGIKSALFFLVTDPSQWSPWVQSPQLEVFDLRHTLPCPSELCDGLRRLLDPKTI